jgi:hypothetical protein
MNLDRIVLNEKAHSRCILHDFTYALFLKWQNNGNGEEINRKEGDMGGKWMWL